MSIPGELKLGNIERGGFINDIIIKTADTVLDLYVGGYFGNEYKPLVNIGDDGVKIERDQLKDFMILTNMEPLAQKYFDEATAATISHWKKNDAGFKDEKKVDQFGLLFSPDGVILTCQTSMSNANEVKAFSDFGAALTIKMQQVNAYAVRIQTGLKSPFSYWVKLPVPDYSSWLHSRLFLSNNE